MLFNTAMTDSLVVHRPHVCLHNHMAGCQPAWRVYTEHAQVWVGRVHPHTQRKRTARDCYANVCASCVMFPDRSIPTDPRLAVVRSRVSDSESLLTPPPQRYPHMPSVPQACGEDVAVPLHLFPLVLLLALAVFNHHRFTATNR